MGYSILYNWQFLKSSEGITPVILIGDNNVTTRVWMGNHWGERRARGWACLFNVAGVSEENFMREIKNMTGKEYQEHWMRNGKWVDDKALVNWAKKACASAASVEDVLSMNPFVYITAYLSVWHKDSKCTHMLETTIRNTDELDAWIRSGNQLSDELRADGAMVFPIVNFSNENLKRFPSGNKNHPATVVVKSKYGYLTDFTVEKESGTISQSSWNCSVKKALKMPYDEALAFQTRGSRRMAVSMRLIDAKAQDAPYDAVISAAPKKENGCMYFVGHVGAKKVRFVYRMEYAKRYSSIKAAERAAKNLNKRSSNFDYQAVQMPAKVGV